MANYLVSQVPAGKQPLIINMDETVVCLFQGASKGIVITGKKRKRDGPVQRVKSSTRRTYLTHAAFICDDPLYQKYLPQFVIGNEHTLLVRDMPELQRNCPHHFALIRQKSAWNNGRLMCTMVEKLAVALAPFASQVQPILLMDAAKLHWVLAVMNTCGRKGVWPMLVPAKLTWLLQPCDTHMFLKYKLHLQKAYQRRRSEAMIGGALDVKNLLICVYEASKHVLEDISGWKQAFLDDGYGASQTQLSAFRRRHLELEASPEVGAHKPSVEQIKQCFPQKQTAPTMSQLFRCSAMPAPPRVRALLLPSGVPRGVRLAGAAPRSAGSLGLALGGGGRPGSSSTAAPAGREPRTRSEHRLVARAKSFPWGA